MGLQSQITTTSRTSSPEGPERGRMPRWTTVAGAALWVAAAAVTAVLALSRYRGAIGPAPFTNATATDFGTFFAAGQAAARGVNFYPAGGGYVFFAPLALVLSLFSHVDRVTVLKGWTVAEMVAFAAAAGSLVHALRSRLAAWWEPPALFAFCAVTGLHLWALVIELFVNEDDIFVLLVLVLAAIALRDDHPVGFGVLVGVGMFLKVWPALLIIAVIQKGIGARARIAAFVSLGVVGIVGLATNLIPAGIHEFTGFFTLLLQKKSQPRLISYSVGGIPRILFSKTGLGRPVLVSGDVRYLATGALVLWVLALLIFCLSRPGDRMLAVFNVMFLAIFIDPVSHLQYSILVLPVVWFWVAQYRMFLDRRGWHGQGLAARIAVAVAVLAWYAVQQRAWPNAPATSSLVEGLTFYVNLALFTASVYGGRVLLGRDEQASPETTSATDRVSEMNTTAAAPGPPVLTSPTSRLHSSLRSEA